MNPWITSLVNNPRWAKERKYAKRQTSARRFDFDTLGIAKMVVCMVANH